MSEQGEQEVQASSVRDIPAEAFIKAYAAHLKTNDKVCSCGLGGL